MIKNMS